MHSSRGRYMVTQSANRSPMGAVDHKLLPTPTMHPNVSAVPLLSRHMLTNQALQVVFARAAADHSFDYLLLEPTSAVSFMLLLASTVTVAKRCFPCHGNRLIYADYGASGVDNSRGGIDGTCLLHPEHKRMLTVTWPNRARMHYMLLQGR